MQPSMIGPIFADYIDNYQCSESMIGPIFGDFIDNYQCSHQDKAKNLEFFSQNQHKDEKLKKVKGLYKS
jgi:hypothetical protein